MVTFRSKTGKLSWQQIQRPVHFDEDREEFFGVGASLHHHWSESCMNWTGTLRPLRKSLSIRSLQAGIAPLRLERAAH